MGSDASQEHRGHQVDTTDEHPGSARGLVWL